MASKNITFRTRLLSIDSNNPDVIAEMPKASKVGSITCNNTGSVNEVLTIGILKTSESNVLEVNEYYSNIRILPNNPFKEFEELLLNGGDKLVAFGTTGNLVTITVVYNTL